jgi:hypothetical protein
MKKIVEYELVLRQNDQPGCGTFDTHHETAYCKWLSDVAGIASTQKE